jgi:DNA-binding HxlR family transcriptional regulator
MTRRTSPKSHEPRSPCPLAGSLDLLGDRWTLLVVRDLFRGKERFGEFQASPEGIPTNLLADRLVRLERAGVITRKPYRDNPPRHSYSLTAKGRLLRPILLAFVDWGKRHIPGTRTMDEIGASAGAGKPRRKA